MGVGAGVGVNVGCGASVAVGCGARVGRGVDVAAGGTGVLAGACVGAAVGAGAVVEVGCGAAVGVGAVVGVGSAPQAIATAEANDKMHTKTAFLNLLRLLKVPIVSNLLLMENALHQVPAGPLLGFFLQPVHQPVLNRLLHVEYGLDKLGWG